MIRLVREAESYERAPIAPPTLIPSGYSPPECLIGFCVTNLVTEELEVIVHSDERFFCVAERARFQALFGKDPITPEMEEFLSRIKASMIAMNSGNLGEALQIAAGEISKEVIILLKGLCALIDPNNQANTSRNARPLNCRVADNEFLDDFEQAWTDFIELARSFFAELHDEADDDSLFSAENIAFVAGLIATFALAYFSVTAILVLRISGGLALGAIGTNVLRGALSILSGLIIGEGKSLLLEYLTNLGLKPEATLEDLLEIVSNDKNLPDIIKQIACKAWIPQFSSTLEILSNSDCSICNSELIAELDSMTSEISSNCTDEVLGLAQELKSSYESHCLTGKCAGYCDHPSECDEGNFCYKGQCVSPEQIPCSDHFICELASGERNVCCTDAGTCAPGTCPDAECDEKKPCPPGRYCAYAPWDPAIHGTCVSPGDIPCAGENGSEGNCKLILQNDKVCCIDGYCRNSPGLCRP